MSENLYWIWFQQLFGMGSRRAELFLNYFDDPREIYDGIKKKDRVFGMLTEAELAACDAAMTRAGEIERRAISKNVDIVTPDSGSYPELLKQIYSKPAVLYVRGDLDCLKNRLAIAMVGAREHTEYGKEAAIWIAAGLAQGDAVVVSGLAHGIDTECHMAALEAGGKSIGVLGCGLDIDYPKGNRDVKRRLSENGAVITEYPFGVQPVAHNFPTRNRIVSGMCHGVVVVEAGISSGSLLTAQHALEQGRDIFAVPGSIFSRREQGTHLLIREGAKLTSGAQDIFDEYEHLGFWRKLDSSYQESGKSYSKKPPMKEDAKENRVPAQEKPHIRKELPEGISGDGKTVIAVFGIDAVTPEEIAEKTDLGIPQILSALTELEIYGLIQGYPGRKFGLASKS